MSISGSTIDLQSGGAVHVAPVAGAASADGESFVIPDAHFLFHAEFTRTGSDLTLTGEDGQRVVLPDYFKHERLPTLFTPEGSALTGDIVAALVGPLAPGQYAQAGGAAPSAPPPIGRVATVQGNATAIRNGAAVTLNVGDAVYKNDVVQTQDGSAVGVIFGDGTTFNLTANARMVLNEFIYNPAPGSANSALITLVQGSITFLAGEVAKTGDMKVGTPVATMGIRGTAVQVDINVNNGETKMSVLIEPGGKVGEFLVYSLSGQLIATVNNANGATIVTPAGPLQAIATEVQKTAAEMAQGFAVVQQVFQTQNVGQAILAAQPVPPSPPAAPPSTPDPNAPNSNDPNSSPPTVKTQITAGDLSTTKITVTATTTGDTVTDSKVAVVSPPPPAVVTPVSPPPLPLPPPLLPPSPPGSPPAPTDVAPNLPVYASTVTAPSNPPAVISTISANGTLAFTDNAQQTGETHTVSATAQAGDLGELKVALQQDTAGKQTDGDIAYTYTVSKDVAAALAAGQTHDDVFFVKVTDEGGNTTESKFTVQLIGVNDAPVMAAPSGSAIATEGHTLLLGTGVTVTDPDAGDVISMTLSVKHGTLALPTSALIDSGNGTATVTLHGSTTAINALLAGLDYSPTAHYAGPDTLTMLAKDVAGDQDTKTIAITVNPFNDGAATLSISGTPQEHATLTANLGADPDGGASGTSFQWFRGVTAISGATGSTYVLTAADVGAQVKVEAKYTDGQGFSENVFSTSTGAVGGTNDGAATLSISGTPQEHATLTANLGVDPDGGPSGTSFQWFRGTTAISGATGSTYVLSAADVGATVKVEAKYIDGQGFSEDVLSPSTGAVSAVNDGAAALTIVGAANEASTLTATLGADPDGGPSSTAFQWFRGSTAISGATGSTYVLTAADVGATLKVEAKYIDSQGFSEDVFSAATAAVGPKNDGAASLTVSGTTQEGSTLTSTLGVDPDGGPSSAAYQWFRGSTAISGATGSTYVLTAADAGSQIKVEAKYTDGQGFSEDVFSSSTVAVGAKNDGAATLTVGGTAQEGSTLTASLGADPDGGPSSAAYQWFRGATAITGATGQTYSLTAADAGSEIKVEAKYTDGQGFAEDVTSAPSATVAAKNDGAATLSIEGTLQEASTLTAKLGSDPDGGPSSASYQWFRGSTAITGATDQSYVVTAADVGAQLKVEAKYTDGQGFSEDVFSSASATVGAKNDGAATLSADGTAQEGSQLTANLGSDPDGGPSSAAYQWFRGSTAISGATDQTYVLTAGDVGAAIKVEAKYTDGQGFSEDVFSPATSTVTAKNDGAATLTIEGAVKEDATLTAKLGSDPDGNPSSVTYQWFRDSSLIVTTSSTTYVVSHADIGHELTVKASYVDGQGFAENVSSDPTGAVVAVNHAPVLTGTNPQLTTITEDQTTNSGQTVGSFLSGHVSEIDDGALQGVAIYAAGGDPIGQWQYSIDGGTTWANFGAVSDTAALLLRDTDKVRFSPDGTTGGTESFIYRAWDRSVGVAGGTADTTIIGGNSAFSSAPDTAHLTVTPVNDAPVLSAHTNTVTYSENSAPQVLLQGVLIEDADKPLNLDGAVIMVSLAGAINTSGDEIVLDSSGGLVTLSGTDLKVGGISVGTFVTTVTANGPEDPQPGVTITFNANASSTTVNTVLDSLAYHSNSDDPTHGGANPTRTATVTYSDAGHDGSGGALSDSATVTINVSAVNDNPAIVVSGSVVTGEIIAPPESQPFTLDAAAYLTHDHNLVNGLGGTNGFGEHVLNVGDDNQNGDVSVKVDVTSVFGPDGLNFFGQKFQYIYINNNGNITFTDAYATFTPQNLSGLADNPMIAAFWADVDTRGDATSPGASGNSDGANRVFYDLDSKNHVLTITWDDVGYYQEHNDKANAFQLQLVGLDNGSFDIVLRYEDINWTTGDASGGVGGLDGPEGIPAHAGYWDGKGHFFELPQSGTANMLDLESINGNTGKAGVDVFVANSDGTVSTTQLTTSGAIKFDDPDTADSHTATSAYQGDDTAFGALTLVKDSDTTGTGTGGQFTWTYAVDPTKLAGLTSPRTETFLVDIADGQGGHAQQQVTITLSGVNDPPGGTDKAVTIDEDNAYTLSKADFGFSDPSDGNALLAVKITTLPAAGTLTINGAAVDAGEFINVADIDAGLLVFTPAADGNGTGYASFTFQVRDDGGTLGGGIDLDPTPNTVTVNVNPVNDDPTVTGAPVSVSLDEDASVLIAGTEDTLVSDVDGDTLDMVLKVSHGTLAGTVDETIQALIDDGKLTIVDNNGSDGQLELSGTAAALTAVLQAGATYAVAHEYIGSDQLQIDITDGHGGEATASVDISVSSENDAPTITNGPVTASLQEDGTNLSSGQLTATDPDAGATQTWKVVGAGSTDVHAADYSFAIDNLKIVRAGSTIVDDAFSSAPVNGGAYSVGVNGTPGTLVTGTDANDRSVVLLDAAHGIATNGIGTSTPFLTNSATRLTGTDPGGTTLSKGVDFSVEARFDLILPNDLSEAYGIRLTDRQAGVPVGGTTGDDAIELRVVKNSTAGAIQVQFRDIDFQGNSGLGSVTTLQNINLALGLPFNGSLPPGEQIALRLSHTAGSNAIIASFDILAADGTTIQTSSFASTGTFTATGSLFSDEDWTQVQIHASSPSTDNSYLTTNYGTMTVDASTGAYSYGLLNGTNGSNIPVQKLAAGQSVEDNFSVQVTDDKGASTSTTAKFTVAGQNDAPILDAGTLPSANEDAGSFGGQSVSTIFSGKFHDVDTGATRAGIAISANNAPGSQGAWQYSTDSGAHWYDVGSVSEGSALVLGISALIRFLPAADFNGSPTALLVHGLDDTYISGGGSFTTDATQVTVNASVNGGTTPVSANAVTLGTTILSVSDAPAGTDGTVTTAEDTPYAFKADDFGFSDSHDGPDLFTGVKISSLPGVGTLTDDGALVTSGQIVSIDDINAGKLVFTAAANASGNNYASFTFQVQDSGSTSNGGANFDLFANTLTIKVTGDNDAPTIANGPVTGNLQEDVTTSASGKLTATDPDPGDTQTWTVDGGTPSAAAQYSFAIDNFKVWRSATGDSSGAVIFEDHFDDGVAPPANPPGFAFGYFGTPTGSVTESGGFAVLDSAHGGAINGFGTSTPYIGNFETLLTDTTSAGLRSDNDFSVEGKFNLSFPDALSEEYGIRLTDRVNSSNLGNDTLELVVRESLAGLIQVQFRDADPTANTTPFNIGTINLDPSFNDGTHRISLRLMHAAGNSTVAAGFDILDSTNAVVQHVDFSSLGTIFNGENWTRAQYFAAAPNPSLSYLSGDYGTLSIDQLGNYTYALRNDATLQALAAGDAKTDTFTLKVVDSSGAPATTTATFNVAGTNDAPVLSTGTLASVGEDTANPAGQTVFAIFSGKVTDVDHDSAFAGIAVSGNTAASSQGVWQYSTDSGTNWYGLGEVSESSALALGENALLRFMPAANFNGTPTALQVHGLDDTYATGGGTFTDGTDRHTADTTTSGGSTPYSTAVSVGTTISAVNDAPVIFAGVGDSAGQTVDEASPTIEASGTSTLQDVDGADNVTLSKYAVAVELNGSTKTSADIGMTDEQLLGYFTIPTGNVLTAPNTSTHFNWSFSGAGSAFDFLGSSDTLKLFYTTRPDDGHGVTTTGDSVITITIDGKNDAPVAHDDTLNSSVAGFSYNSDNGHWYKVNTTDLSWASAKTEAESAGGYLATITSAAENAFVAELIGSAGSFYAWTSGSDAGAEGQWRWDAGPEAGTLFWTGNASGTASGYTNWQSSEPNDGGGSNDEDYLYIRPTIDEGVWNDYNGDGTGGSHSPIPSVIEVSIVEDVDSTIPSAFLLANDTDVEGQTRSINSVSAASAHGGTVTLLANGNVQYHSAENYSGTDSFTYTVKDASNAVSNTATVTFTVEAAADAPTLEAPSTDSTPHVVSDGLLLNVTETGNQQSPTIEVFADSTALAIWRSDHLGSNAFFARQIDADGVPIGAEHQLTANGTAFSNPYETTLLDNGNVLLAWNNSSAQVQVLEVSPTGAAIGSPINIGTGAGVSVSARPDGGAYVAWAVSTGGGNSDVRVRAIDADDNLGPTITINENTSSSNFEAAIVSLEDGGFAVAWRSTANDSLRDIFVRIYDENGNPVTGSLQVNTSAGEQAWPDIIQKDNGNIVVAWSSRTTDPWEPVVREIDLNGNFLTDEIVANTSAPAGPSNIVINSLPDDGYVVGWSVGSSAHGQRFDANNDRVGEEFSFASSSMQDFAVDHDGNLVVVGSVSGGDAQGDAVEVSKFEVPELNYEDQPISLNITTALTDVDGSETLSLSVSSVPVGATLADEHGHSFTASAGDTTVNVSAWTLGELTITPAANFNGAFDLVITATATEQANGATASSQVTQTVNITAVNDAAVIGNPSAASVTEDSDVNSGNLVTSGTISISDPDGHGEESFKTTVDGDEHNLGSLDLHTDGSYTYTVGNADVQSLGKDDTQVDKFTVTSFDGTTKDISFTIHGVNDAPTIDAASLAAVDEDTVSPDGQTVADIFASKFHDIDGPNEITGIAVIANNADPSEGVWQYQTSPERGWEDVGTATATEALAFSADTLLRFVPAGDFNGTPGSLTVYGLDNTFDTDDFTIGFAIGGERYTIDTTTHGGTTPISAASVELTTSINPVNDAPTGGVAITADGEYVAGTTLTADTSTLADVDGLPSTLSYQWFYVVDVPGPGTVIGQAIDGATESTYTLTSADIGKNIYVEVSYTDDDGTAELIDSDFTDAIGAGGSPSPTLYTWEGPSNTPLAWSNAGAWNPEDGPPGENDDALIPVNSGIVTAEDTSIEVHSLTINGDEASVQLTDADITIGGDLILEQGSWIEATLEDEDTGIDVSGDDARVFSLRNHSYLLGDGADIEISGPLSSFELAWSSHLTTYGADITLDVDVDGDLVIGTVGETEDQSVIEAGKNLAIGGAVVNFVVAGGAGLAAHGGTITIDPCISGDFVNDGSITADGTGQLVPSGDIVPIGDIEIDSDIGGAFTNSGQMTASRDISISGSTGGNFDNFGSISADHDLTICVDVGGSFENSFNLANSFIIATLSAGGALSIEGSVADDFVNETSRVIAAHGGTLTISLGIGDALGDDFVNNGQITADGTDQPIPSGDIVPIGDIAIDSDIGGSFLNAGDITANRDITIGGSIGNGFANSGSISADNNLTICVDVTGNFENSDTLSAGAELWIDGSTTGDFHNAKCDTILAAGGAVHIWLSIGGDFINDGSVEAQTSTDDSGNIVMYGDIDIDNTITGNFTNSGDLTASRLTIGGSSADTIGGDFSNTGQISAGSVLNDGALVVLGDLNIYEEIGGGFSNSGDITANRNVTISGSTGTDFSNSGGIFASGDLAISTAIGGAFTNSGTLSAGETDASGNVVMTGDLLIDAAIEGSFTNSATVYANGHLTISGPIGGDFVNAECGDIDVVGLTISAGVGPTFQNKGTVELRGSHNGSIGVEVDNSGTISFFGTPALLDHIGTGLHFTGFVTNSGTISVTDIGYASFSAGLTNEACGVIAAGGQELIQPDEEDPESWYYISSVVDFAGDIANSGEIKTGEGAAGGVLRFFNGAVDNADGRISSLSEGTVEFHNTTIQGGTILAGSLISIFGASMFDGTNVTVELHEDDDAAGGHFEVASFDSLTLRGTIESYNTIVVQDHADLVIDGVVDLDGSGTISLGGDAARIVGSYNDGTLTNFNTITGIGQIGVASGTILTLFNYGSIDASADDSLTFNMAVTNAGDAENELYGTIRAVDGGHIVIHGVVDDPINDPDGHALNNQGFVESEGANSLITIDRHTVSYTSIVARDGGHIHFKSTLDNYGLLQADPLAPLGTDITVDQLVNNSVDVGNGLRGVIEASGASATIHLNSNVTNDGDIRAIDGGLIYFGGPLGVYHTDTITGTFTLEGGTFDFGGAVGDGAFNKVTVTFTAGTADTVIIEDLDQFHATLSGFGAGDVLHLDVSSPAVQDLQFDAGALTFTVGGISHSIAFTGGSYTTDNFFLQDDGEGGTNIAYDQPVNLGDMELVDTPPSGTVAYFWPTFSPDGERLAFWSIDDKVHIVIETSGGGQSVIDASSSDSLTFEFSPITFSYGGKYVTFESDDDSLVAQADGSAQVYLADTTNGDLTLVSTNGSGDLLGDSILPILSPFEDKVAFWTYDDDSDIWNLVIKDYSSATSDPVVLFHGPEDENFSAPSFSADGKKLAFSAFDGESNHERIYIGDLNSPESFGTPLSGYDSNHAEPVTIDGVEGILSPNGHVIAFLSQTASLADGAVDGDWNVFVENLDTMEITWIADGGQNYDRSIVFSPNGQLLAFNTDAALVPDDTNNSMDIYIRDLVTGVTSLVSSTSDGSAGDDHSYDPAFSPDGTWIAFDSFAGDLTDEDTHGNDSIFVRSLFGGSSGGGSPTITWQGTESDNTIVFDVTGIDPALISIDWGDETYVDEGGSATHFTHAYVPGTEDDLHIFLDDVEALYHFVVAPSGATANELDGTSNADVLVGSPSATSNTFDGLGGDDILYASAAQDTFVFRSLFDGGHDTVVGYDPSDDYLDISHWGNETNDVAAFLSGHASDTPDGVLITLDESTSVLLRDIAHKTDLDLSHIIGHQPPGGG